jgi:hypothetical protein
MVGHTQPEVDVDGSNLKGPIKVVSQRQTEFTGANLRELRIPVLTGYPEARRLKELSTLPLGD